jgi:signal peptidase I
MAASRKKRPKGPVANIVELVATVAVAIGLALLIQAFLVKPYRIPSGSMIPTLKIGQRILVSRLSTHPGLGDIVVFHPPAGADEQPATCGNPTQGTGHQIPCDAPTPTESKQTFVKRVVGLPGDHLRITDGHVWRNGVEETGSYIQPCPTAQDCTWPGTFTVPAGNYYMMTRSSGAALVAGERP